MDSNNTPRFLINANKVHPYNTIGVGDWVVFDLFDGDCKIGKIIGFEAETYSTSDIMAIIEMPTGDIKKHNVFLELRHGLFKVDHYCAENIKFIKED